MSNSDSIRNDDNENVSILQPTMTRTSPYVMMSHSHRRTMATSSMITTTNDVITKTIPTTPLNTTCRTLATNTGKLSGKLSISNDETTAKKKGSGGVHDSFQFHPRAREQFQNTPSSSRNLTNDDDKKNSNTIIMTPPPPTAMSTTTIVTKSHNLWNELIQSYGLGFELVGDIIIAMIVTAGVSPFLTVIDQAMVQCSAASATTTTTTINGNNKNSKPVTMMSSISHNVQKVVQKPIHYLQSPAFLFMWATYATTYITANIFHTLTQENNNRLRQKQQQQRQEQQQQLMSSSEQYYHHHHHHHHQHPKQQQQPELSNENIILATTSTHPRTRLSLVGAGKRRREHDLLHEHHHYHHPLSSSPPAAAPSPPPLSSSTSSNIWTLDPTVMSILSFVSTTMANSGAAMIKDRVYTKLFGTTAAATIPPPRLTYALWLSRDFTVIGSSFVLPSLLATWWDNHNHNNSFFNNHHQHTTTTSSSSLAMAQLITPVAAQLIAGPLHAMGLDLANGKRLPSLSSSSWFQQFKPQLQLFQQQQQQQQQMMKNFNPSINTVVVDAAAGGGGDWQRLWSSWRSIIPARMIRILPGYGLGGVGNQQLRTMWKQQIEVWQISSKNNKNYNECQYTNTNNDIIGTTMIASSSSTTK